MIRRPPRSTLFPSTPLFRSVRADPTSRYAYALRQPAYQARGAFTAMLDELLELLRAEAHRSEEHTSELQSRLHLVCRLLLEKKKTTCLLRPGTWRKVAIVGP